MVATRTQPRPASTSSRPIDERVTERIVSSLAAGVVPWQQAHHRLTNGTIEVPCNYASGHPYSGQNLMLLACNPHDRPYYLTYKQAQQLGGQVRKGATGEFILFCKTSARVDEQTGKERNQFLMRVSYVFHIDQIDGIDFILPERVTLDVADHEQAALQQADELVRACLERLQLTQVPGGVKASYLKESDRIRMPDKASYIHPAGYYKTLLHELVHASGAVHRLNRPSLVNNEGRRLTDPRVYSLEELTAELGAAMLAMQCGLDTQAEASTEKSAAYIQSWSRFFKSDPTAFRTAIRQANQAVNYLTGTVEATPEAEEQ